MLSLQLSAVQWGVAIAAEAFSAGPDGEPTELFRSGQRTLRDADEIARAVLSTF